MALVWPDLANVPTPPATLAEVREPGHRLPGQLLRNPGKNCKNASLKGQRCTRHITATLDWDLKQFNIKTAFLHGILPDNETMYMQQPKGFKVLGKEEWVMQLKKSIYSMKQAGHC